MLKFTRRVTDEKFGHCFDSVVKTASGVGSTKLVANLPWRNLRQVAANTVASLVSTKQW